MFVKDWMSKTVITIDVKDPMNRPMDLMKEYDYELCTG